MKKIIVFALLFAFNSSIIAQQVGYAIIQPDTTGVDVYIDNAKVGKAPLDRSFTLTIGTHVATVFPSSIQSELNDYRTSANQAGAISIGRGGDIFGMIVSSHMKSKSKKYQDYIDRGTSTFLIQPNETTKVYLPIASLIRDIKRQEYTSQKSKEDAQNSLGLFAGIIGFGLIVGFIATGLSSK